MRPNRRPADSYTAGSRDVPLLCVEISSEDEATGDHLGYRRVWNNPYIDGRDRPRVVHAQSVPGHASRAPGTMRSSHASTRLAL